MNVLKTLLASTALVLAAPSFAGSVIPPLTFETIGDLANLSQPANNPYASSGISFSSNAFGIRSHKDAGGSGYFFRDPVNLGALTMFNDSPGQEAALTLTVAGGFSDFFSIEYTGTVAAAGSIQILDATGALLGSQLLNDQSGSCPTSSNELCEWSLTKLEFKGTAHSIKLTGGSFAYFFDNIQIGRADPSNVPEPGSLALGFAALAALGLSRRKAR